MHVSCFGWIFGSLSAARRINKIWWAVVWFYERGNIARKLLKSLRAQTARNDWRERLKGCKLLWFLCVQFAYEMELRRTKVVKQVARFLWVECVPVMWPRHNNGHGYFHFEKLFMTWNTIPMKITHMKLIRQRSNYWHIFLLLLVIAPTQKVSWVWRTAPMISNVRI